MSRRHLAPLLILAAIAALPLLTGNDFYLDTAVQVLIWAGLALAWNVSGGYAGQLSLGHSAFMGLGAYTSTLLLGRLGVSPWLGMLAGMALALGLALFIGYVTTRLRGPYFTLATIAFAQVLLIVAANWDKLTEGAEGLRIPFQPGLPNFSFHGREPWLYVALAMVGLIYLVSEWVENSRFGYNLAGVRENEDAAQALGIDPRWMKMLAIGVSATFTAMMGTLNAQYVGFIEPYSTFSGDTSIRIALVAIIGGMGSALGPLLGAILMIPLETYLRSAFGNSQSGLYLVIYGTVLVVVVLFLPNGLVDGIGRLTRGIGRRRRPREVVGRAA